MNDSLLIIADFAPQIKGEIQTIGIQDLDLEKLFNNSINSNTIYLCIHRDTERIVKNIFSEVKIIKAAGGLVKNGNGEYLFIHRLGKWDLPKGKVEEGEKMRDAAVREVEEECGIKINYLGPKISTTYHTYMYRGKFVLKQTKWYEMAVNKEPKLIPQLEEDITEATWMDKSMLGQVYENTYPLIKEILDKI